MMITIFGASERRAKKSVIDQMNADLNRELDKIFEKSYPDIYQQFLDSGFSEEEARTSMAEIKSEMQREMIVKAQQSLREKLRLKATEKASTNSEAEATEDRKNISSDRSNSPSI